MILYTYDGHTIEIDSQSSQTIINNQLDVNTIQAVRFQQYIIVNKGIISADLNSWAANYYGVFIPLKNTKFVKVNSGSSATYLAFLTSDSTTGSVPYVEGTTRMSYSANKTRVIPVPEGAKFIFFHLGSTTDYVYGPKWVGLFKNLDGISLSYKNQEEKIRNEIDICHRGLGLRPVSYVLDSSGWEVPQTLQQKMVVDKCNLFCNIKWTPKKNMARKGTPTVFTAGTTYTSIPYGSNTDDMKAVGVEVSFYTFLTAINNPYSLLYTERIYKGNSVSVWGRTYYCSNAHSYYGIVCCGLTAAVVNQPVKYGNNTHPIIARTQRRFIPIYNQDVDDLQIGDVFDNPDHSFVIYGIQRNTSTYAITNIKICESTSASNQSECHLKTLTKANFVSTYINKEEKPYIGYRVADLYRNTTIENITLSNGVPSNITYNNDICTFAGDKASFAEGDLVVLNYNLTDTPSYTWTAIQVYKDDTLLNTYTLSSITQNELPSGQQNHALKLGTTLAPGKYKARMMDNSSHYSSYTYWEVLPDPTVTKLADGTFLVSQNEGEISYAYVGHMTSYFWGSYCGREPSIEEQDQNAMLLYPYETAKAWGQDPGRVTHLRIATRGLYGIATSHPIELGDGGYVEAESDQYIEGESQ